MSDRLRRLRIQLDAVWEHAMALHTKFGMLEEADLRSRELEEATADEELEQWCV